MGGGKLYHHNLPSAAPLPHLTARMTPSSKTSVTAGSQPQAAAAAAGSAADPAGQLQADQDRKIVNEFCHLLEKSKQLFNGLRDMPQYGHKQWQVNCIVSNNKYTINFV